MSRIDANVATQVGDSTRVRQTAIDLTLQAQTAQVASVREVDTASAPIKADDVRAAAAQLKQVVQGATSRRLGFEVDEHSGDLFVKVTDEESGEVVKQIPSEAVLRMRDRLQEMIGMFVDERA